MNEFDIVREFLSDIGPDDGVRLGVGDDAAIVEMPEAADLFVSTDTLIEDVHFPGSMLPEDVGWRALAVNLSDAAAMGATPKWFTLALSLPQADREWLGSFTRGLRASAEENAVALVGGDLTRGSLSVSITVLAVRPAGTGLLRSGARPGDAIYVSGSLGGAAASLANLGSDSNPWFEKLSRPRPRIALGSALAEFASAAIDISDGLVADLGHICRASECGATVFLERVPVADGLKERFPKTWADWALTGGDDYELCFTVPPDAADRVPEVARRLALPLAKIGTVAAFEGVRVEAGAEPWESSVDVGYRHF